MDTLKHLGQLTLMTLVAVAAWALASNAELLVLETRLTTASGIKHDEWLSGFENVATLGIVTSWSASVLWYLLAPLFGLTHWEHARHHRSLWLVLFVLGPSGACVAAWLMLPAAQEGRPLAFSFILLNNALVYYLATACFSPAAVKYTPPGARWIRQWR